MYLYWKSLHIIFVVTWFAGLFYIVRLFVYQIEALEKPQPDRDILSKQLALMSQRLWYIITWPSAVLTILFASLLLYEMPIWLTERWMHLKLFFVFCLCLYHLKCHHLYTQLQRKYCSWTSVQMRLWNEVATLVLFAVVFLVVLKHTIHWLYGLLALLFFGLLLMLSVKFYKYYRSKK